MISCHLYDYIEIACMHQYPVKFTMKDAQVIHCIALDTQYNDKKQECIKVEQVRAESINLKISAKKNNNKLNDNSLNKGQYSLILLDEIATLDVLIDNPHFKFVSFI